VQSPYHRQLRVGGGWREFALALAAHRNTQQGKHLACPQGMSEHLNLGRPYGTSVTAGHPSQVGG